MHLSWWLVCSAVLTRFELKNFSFYLLLSCTLSRLFGDIFILSNLGETIRHSTSSETWYTTPMSLNNLKRASMRAMIFSNLLLYMCHILTATLQILGMDSLTDTSSTAVFSDPHNVWMGHLNAENSCSKHLPKDRNPVCFLLSPRFDGDISVQSVIHASKA